MELKNRKYFSFKDFENQGYIRNGGMCIVIATRSIGKTFGSIYELLETGRIDNDNQIAIVRNSAEEFKMFNRQFNDRYKEYQIISNTIYRMKPKTWVEKKTGEEKTTYEREYQVGICAPISARGIDSTRSGDYNKIKYIICDEFNLVNNNLNWDKFQAFYKTVARDRKDVKTLLIGNRDDAACDILTALRINVAPPNGWYNADTNPDGHKGTWEHYFVEGHPEFVYLNLDDNEWLEGVDVDNDAWTVLMRNSRNAHYVAGQFLDYRNMDCKWMTFDDRLNVDWFMRVIWDDRFKIMVGEDEEGTLIVHNDTHNEYDMLDIETYALGISIKAKFSALDLNKYNDKIWLNVAHYWVEDLPKQFTTIEIKQVFQTVLNRGYDLHKEKTETWEM